MDVTGFTLGCLVGGVVVSVVCALRHYSVRKQEIVEQEKDYALLQKHVDACVNVIERIIYRSKP
jgi:hypothetical protein